ncbi:TonB-dependent receptor [Pseudemcibacter aquimaris]|uniref:TonB-dependent receptor n=1 Tax=Pseudemcibacter aquimaris TaxID=2857064 RepID=UPI002011C34F|nr:TonB-dependent receptor [Pseudemcibacter aquimaris]MCC3862011.1 TonB-dependent receptor [Pseudemcibacter aquimaris]WDU58763.1 TonB-dependent receptor [Pseudemcibacter aquimaris]
MAFSKKKCRLALMAGISSYALMAASAHAADVTGRVVAKSDNNGLEGAIVSVSDSNYRATTERDGSFRIPNLPTGQHTLVVKYIGADSIAKTIDVVDGESAPVEIALSAAGAVDHILVVGQRGSLNSSISKQRAADNISNFLTADNAGNFPDQNIAEAARRLVGLSVENDQGEGRYIVVRGLDSNLNSTSFNGVSLPSPEGDTRKVALDVIPSDMLETVEVTKSATPDMDGNFIGGNVEVRTISGFDREELFLKGKLELGYNDLEDAYNPMGSFTFANPLSEQFAVSGGISYKSRKFGATNFESGGEYADEDDLDVPAMEELEFRDYKVTRDRIGAAFNIDIRPDEDNELYIRSMYTDFKDEEYRDRMEVSFGKGDIDFDNSSGSTVNFTDFRVDRELKDRLETQKIYSVITGGESYVDNFKFEYSASYAHAEETEPDRLDIAYRQKDLSGGINLADPMMPMLAFDNDQLAALNDLSAYELDGIEWIDGITEDKQWTFKFDMTYETDLNGVQAAFKFGTKYATREKVRDVSFVEYEDFDEGDFVGTVFDGMTLADVSAPIDHNIDTTTFNNGVRTDWSKEYLSALQTAGGTFDPDDAHEDAILDDYKVEEDIFAAYAMGTFNVDDFTIIGGVRWEQTKVDTFGNVLQEGDDEGFQEFTRSRKYDNFLPSLNIKYSPSDDLVIRGAYYRTVVRPNFSDMVPSGTIEYEDGIRSGSLGNPDLSPYKADNFDFGIEYYPNNKSILSAGIFHKKLGSFIYEQGLSDTNYLGRFYDDLSIPNNGEEAEVTGVELNAQTQLSSLPAPFDGVILGVNYTYVDSSASIEDGDGNPYLTPLPKTSSNIANFIIGYEKGGFAARFAVSYQSEYLDEVFSEGDDDRYVLDHVQIDAQASYEFFEGFEVYAQVSNLNNRNFRAALRHGSTDYLSQRDEFGWTGNTGIKFKY